jgi:putative ABC transport system substrate-binding protein
MRRREFITLISGVAAVWPLAARAQQPAKRPTIGFLGTNTPSAQERWTAAFVQRLHELGWIEGRNVAVEYRWADGRTERFAELATELVNLKVDVIVTLGAAVTAVKQVIPNLSRLAIIANFGNSASVVEAEEARVRAQAFGLDVDTLEIRQPSDIAPAFAALKVQAQALYVCNDPLTVTNRIEINTLALRARLPTVSGSRVQVEAGGLISYAASFSDLFRRAADIVDKILRGTKPGDIPVEQPTKFEFIINLTTAKALGLEVPLHLQQLADEVIE